MISLKIIIPALLSSLLLGCGRKFEETQPIVQDVNEMVFASGFLEANNSYNLTAKTDGYIIDLKFNEGDIIKKDQLLAEIENKENTLNQENADALFQIAASNVNSNSPSLRQALNNIETAKQKATLDSINYFRHLNLYLKNSITKMELEAKELQFITSKSNVILAIENYQLAKQIVEEQLIISETNKKIKKVNSNTNSIKGIVPGKVYKKYKNKGDYIKKGEVIATIGDADSMYAKVSIDEGSIRQVQLGQKALIQLNIDKTKIYRGYVSEIFPTFDESSQSFWCKLIFNEKIDFKLSGTQLQANIIIQKTEKALLIPRHFLNPDGTVTLHTGEKIKVVSAFISNKWVRIISGITSHSIIKVENTSRGNGIGKQAESQIRI